jgi:hypothetical protein
MANIMGLLGGLGQGISAGVQDLERMEEAKNRKEEAQFRKELQQRERERLAEEKRVGEQIKGIQTEMPPEYDASMSAITQPAQKLSRAQMLARQAEIYSASPDRANQQLGLQLANAARAETNAEKLQAIQTGYADTLKAINTDPNKWVQENLAKFNADEYGGPGTKGVIAAPMSTPQGTVLSIMGPQGQQLQQIPVTRQDMMRVAKSMYLDELSGVSPEYAKLAMDQERLGLERAGLGLKQQANESDAEYRRRTAAASERELDAKIKSGYFNKAPERFSPLGLSDDATRMLGVRGGALAEMPIPAGYSKGSFPKVAEKGPAGVDIRKTDEGFIAFNKTTGKPVYNLGSKGQPLPIGVSESDLLTREKQAASAGIPLEMRSDPESGKLIIGYKGRDGNYYDSLEEARKAKPAKK